MPISGGYRRISSAGAAAYDAGRDRQATVRILSSFDLERQVEAPGATWLDRRLVGRGPSDLAPARLRRGGATGDGAAA